MWLHLYPGDCFLRLHHPGGFSRLALAHKLEESGLSADMQNVIFLYTIQMFGKLILPQKERTFRQYQICNKAAKATKKTITRLKIIKKR